MWDGLLLYLSARERTPNTKQFEAVFKEKSQKTKKVLDKRPRV